MGPSYGADAAAKVPYSGPGPGIWDLNLVGLDLKDLANVVLNFAMSFCISLAFHGVFLLSAAFLSDTLGVFT